MIDPRRRRTWLAVAAVVVCAVLPFLPSVNNRFALDDQLVIEQNPRIADPLDFRAIWLTDWWYAAGVRALSPDRDLLYRPLVTQLFALLYAAFGLNPVPYHVLSLACHALASLAVMALTYRLFRRGTFAVVTAVVFAVHPIHAEAVISLVGLAEILATLFVCLGLLAFVRAEGRASAGAGTALRIAGGACFLLALLAKEQGLAFVVLLPLCLWWSRRARDLPPSCSANARTVNGSEPRVAVRGAVARSEPRSANAVTPESSDARSAKARTAPTEGGSVRVLKPLVLWMVTTVVVLSIYLPLRHKALGGHLITPGRPPVMSNVMSVTHGAERVWTLAAITGEYVRLVFWPSRLSCDYSYNAVPVASSAADPRVVRALLCLALLALWSVASVARTRLGLFVTLFTVGTYLLPSNVLVVFRTMVAERLFYFPLLPVTWAVLFAAFAVARAVAKVNLPGRVGPMLAVGCVLALVLSSAARDLLRCEAWKDNERLYLTDAETRPRCARLQLKRGLVFIHHGDWEQGRKGIEQALSIAPDYVEAHFELLAYFNRFGPWESAWREFEYVLTSLGPVPPIVAQQMAARGIHRGLPDARAPASQEATASTGANVPDLQAVRDAVLSAIRRGAFEEAVTALDGLVRTDAASVEDRLLLARVLMVMRRTGPAAEQYGAVLDAEPENPEAMACLAMIIVLGQPDAAAALAARAAELAPDDDLIQLGAASVFFFVGDAQASGRIMLSLARRLPRDDPTRRIVVKLLPPDAPI